MTEFKCEYCDSVFNNKYNMKNHQKRTKYCLEKQKKINIKVDEDLKTCEHCFSKYAPMLLNRHLLTCKIKKQNELNAFENKIKNLEKIINENEIEKEKIKKLEKKIIEKDKLISQNKKTLSEKEKIIIEKDLIISNLQGKLDIIEKDHECLIQIAKQPKTTNTNTTNNKILNLSPLDLSVERIKDIIDTEFNHNYGYGGQKGAAEFAKEKLLLDDDGNLNYVCTDFDRKVFKYKDSAGEVRKDTKAKKLTNKLVKAGLIERNQNASEQWWVDEKGEIIKNKKNFMVEKIAEINNIENDNSVFVKELSAITVP